MYTSYQLFSFRYVDDESSPLYNDPYNTEEYSYHILSKTLAKKQVSLPVAGAAKPVQQECSHSDAVKAVHGGPGRSSGSVRGSHVTQNGTLEVNKIACQVELGEMKKQRLAEMEDQEKQKLEEVDGEKKQKKEGDRNSLELAKADDESKLGGEGKHGLVVETKEKKEEDRRQET